MTKPTLGNYKFRISSPEQSERLQKVLFGLGYRWYAGGCSTCHIEKSYLYTEEDKSITYEDDADWFENCSDSLEEDTESFIAQHTFVEVNAEPEPVKRNKYSRQIKKDVWVDVYDVLEAFKVTSPTLQHLAKKALCAGLRGHKDERQDLVDILDSAKRALEMYDNKVTE